MNQKTALKISAAAEEEIFEAAGYYDFESPGLGDAFLEMVERAFNDLQKFPESGGIIRGKYRKIVLVKFPYILIYSIEKYGVLIFAVAHQKKRPFYWLTRRKGGSEN